jgi:hypothetical protein
MSWFNTLFGKEHQNVGHYTEIKGDPYEFSRGDIWLKSFSILALWPLHQWPACAWGRELGVNAHPRPHTDKLPSKAHSLLQPLIWDCCDTTRHVVCWRLFYQNLNHHLCRHWSRRLTRKLLYRGRQRGKKQGGWQLSSVTQSEGEWAAMIFSIAIATSPIVLSMRLASVSLLSRPV